MKVSYAHTPLTCGCGLQMDTRRIETDVDGTGSVLVGLCRSCDVRTCTKVVGKTSDGQPVKCEAKAKTPTDARCPQGHLF